MYTSDLTVFQHGSSGNFWHIEEKRNGTSFSRVGVELRKRIAVFFLLLILASLSVFVYGLDDDDIFGNPDFVDVIVVTTVTFIFFHRLDYSQKLFGVRF